VSWVEGIKRMLRMQADSQQTDDEHERKRLADARRRVQILDLRADPLLHREELRRKSRGAQR
jgi:hypothetical protein